MSSAKQADKWPTQKQKNSCEVISFQKKNKGETAKRKKEKKIQLTFLSLLKSYKTNALLLLLILN